MKRTGMRHARLVIVLAAVVAATVATRDARTAEPRLPPKPNVLFIAIDDLRDWVGYLGKNRRSRRPISTGCHAAACISPTATAPRRCCNPSRAALLSGCGPPPRASMRTASTGGRSIPAEATVTLPLHFKNNGYYVAGAGKIYHEADLQPRSAIGTIT